jgi:hypothetical protein
MLVLFTVANQPNLSDGYVFYSDNTFKTGLSTVVATLAGGTLPPTPAILYNAVYSYIQPIYYPSSGPPPTQQLQNLNAMLGNHFDAYLDPKNPAWAFYNQKQLTIINDFINQLNKVPINKLAINNNGNFIAISGENLAFSCLTIHEQAPLLIAMTVTGSAVNLLYPQILSPNASWATFFDPSSAVNFMNLRKWLTAAFVGALIGATQSTTDMPTTATDGAGIGNNLITTTTSALFATFGSIIFQWEQRPPLIKNCKRR